MGYKRKTLEWRIKMKRFEHVDEEVLGNVPNNQIDKHL